MTVFRIECELDDERDKASLEGVVFGRQAVLAHQRLTQWIEAELTPGSLRTEDERKLLRLVLDKQAAFLEGKKDIDDEDDS